MSWVLGAVSNGRAERPSARPQHPVVWASIRGTWAGPDDTFCCLASSGGLSTCITRCASNGGVLQHVAARQPTSLGADHRTVVTKMQQRRDTRRGLGPAVAAVVVD